MAAPDTRPASINGSAITSAETWNAFVRNHEGHLLQSWEWGVFKEHHGWQAERILVESGRGSAAAQVLYRSRGPVGMGYVPRGPVITGDAARAWELLRRELDRSALRHRAIMTVLEPDRDLGLTGSLRDAGVSRGPAHIQPGRTVMIPLGTDEAILTQMHQKTRYNVRLASRRGVVIESTEPTPTTIDTFHALMVDTSTRNDFSIHSREYYADFLRTMGDNACLAFARVDDGEIGAGLICARFGTTAVYMYGASSSTHRSHGAAFLLQFEAMKWARDRGCTRYDLWGIPEQDPESSSNDDANRIAGTRGDDWRGLYRFKTGFGGEILNYPKTLERRHVPVLPWVVRKMNLVQG